MLDLVKNIEYKGREIKVNYKRLEQYLEDLNNVFNELIEDATLSVGESGNLLFCKLYEVEEMEEITGTLEDIENEKEEFKNLLMEILKFDDTTKKYLDGINVKKNGKFRKSAVLEIKNVESATRYYSEFTNSWATYQLRFKALGEDVLDLDLVSVTING